MKGEATADSTNHCPLTATHCTAPWPSSTHADDAEVEAARGHPSIDAISSRRGRGRAVAQSAPTRTEPCMQAVEEDGPFVNSREKTTTHIQGKQTLAALYRGRAVHSHLVGLWSGESTMESSVRVASGRRHHDRSHKSHVSCCMGRRTDHSMEHKSSQSRTAQQYKSHGSIPEGAHQELRKASFDDDSSSSQGEERTRDVQTSGVSCIISDVSRRVEAPLQPPWMADSISDPALGNGHCFYHRIVLHDLSDERRQHLHRR